MREIKISFGDLGYEESHTITIQEYINDADMHEDILYMTSGKSDEHTYYQNIILDEEQIRQLIKKLCFFLGIRCEK